MQIIIDIPDDWERRIKCNIRPNTIECGELVESVWKGEMLPKGHGRLIILSEDKLKENLMNLDFSCQKWIGEVNLACSTVAIIKADSED